MVRRWRIFGDFLRSVFSTSNVQQVLDLHPKFALRPHHVCKYGMVDIQSATAEIRRGTEKKEEERRSKKNPLQGKNIT